LGKSDPLAEKIGGNISQFGFHNIRHLADLHVHGIMRIFVQVSEREVTKTIRRSPYCYQTKTKVFSADSGSHWSDWNENLYSHIVDIN